jgi:hypothetical protein
MTGRSVDAFADSPSAVQNRVRVCTKTRVTDVYCRCWMADRLSGANGAATSTRRSSVNGIAQTTRSAVNARGAPAWVATTRTPAPWCSRPVTGVPYLMRSPSRAASALGNAVASVLVRHQVPNPLARRPLAGVRLDGDGEDRGLRAAVPRSGRARADLVRRRADADLGARWTAALLRTVRLE